MTHYVLIYHVVEDYITRRAQFRDEHLALAREANARGELLLGGAFADPPDAALLVWRVHDTQKIEEFVRQDPYVRNGLVTRFEIREWAVVIGGP